MTPHSARRGRGKRETRWFEIECYLRSLLLTFQQDEVLGLISSSWRDGRRTAADAAICASSGSTESCLRETARPTSREPGSESPGQ